MAKKEKQIKTDKVTKVKEKRAGEAAKAVKTPIKKASKTKIQEVTEMQQLDGKNYNKYGVKSIDELLGETDRKYTTHDPKEYRELIENMNTSDLQRHAISVGVLPKEDRRVLIKTLMNQFEKTNSSYFNTTQAQNVQPKKITKEMLDILSEGR